MLGGKGAIVPGHGDWSLPHPNLSNIPRGRDIPVDDFDQVLMYSKPGHICSMFVHGRLINLINRGK